MTCCGQVPRTAHQRTEWSQLKSSAWGSRLVFTRRGDCVSVAASWVAVPVLALPGIALASTAGTDPRMIPDFEIPISYVTDTGREVSCSIELFNGEMNYVESR
ncbi:MAG: hypothetical protein K0R99_4492 [Microbacterium sp.]|jgi:hypothetical protein|nr:hypothetical protein [Microbacterium sp.]